MNVDIVEEAPTMNTFEEREALEEMVDRVAGRQSEYNVSNRDDDEQSLDYNPSSYESTGTQI